MKWRWTVFCLPIPALLFAAACQRGAAPSPLRDGPPVLRVFRVENGDTVSGIAERFGVPGGVATIVELNGLYDPDHLVRHQGLLLPDGPLTGNLPTYGIRRPPTDSFRACASARYWPAPVDEAIPGCGNGACTRLDDRAVCFCKHPYGNDLDSAQGEALLEGEMVGFHLLVGTTELGLWRGALPWMQAARLFAVADADLDGDGDREIVVSVNVVQGNGLGIMTSRIGVFESFDARPMQLVLDDGGQETLVEATGHQRCDLLVTEWKDFEHPLKGPGCHFTGRRWRYRNGTLEPAGPSLVRRLWDRSEDDATREAEDPALSDVEDHPWDESWVRFPARWLSSPDTEEWPTDPLADPARGQPRVGRVVEVRLPERPGPGDVPTLMVLMDGHGEPEPFRVQGFSSGSPEWPITRVGDAGTGAVFPSDYVPADPVAAWTGRSVRIENWGEPWRSGRTVWLAGLWLGPLWVVGALQGLP
ncbi:MAG: LysM peptidoglycan-binding domain-containing protein [Deltaproteobacteria bacterium]|nr:LysM peptidoglycan-binding domain-containing protein [Deltaproteobacteria bacterium]